jgi:hypothetical protein
VNGKKKLNKRQLAKLSEANVSHRIAPHRSTTTRHHVTSAGQSTVEVPLHTSRSGKMKIEISDLLGPPSEDAAGDVTIDEQTDPRNKPHDPVQLAEDRTQVRAVDFIPHHH